MKKLFLLPLLATTFVALLNSAETGEEPLPEVRTLVERYYQGMGGRSAHEQLISFRANGRILRGDSEESFTVFRKRPDRFRISQTSRNITTILGFEGNNAWRMVIQNNEIVFSEKMEEDGLDTLRLEAEFNGPLLTTASLSRNLKVVDREQVENEGEEEVFVLEGFVPSIDRLSRLAINGSTGRELWWELASDDKVRRTDFSDYRDVDGYPFSHRMMISTNGEVDSIILIDQIDINVGLFDAFFTQEFALDSKPIAADARINE